MLENTHGRIYKSHGGVYACAIKSGANHLLVPRSVHSSDQSKDRIYHLLGDELQGNYVAWEYSDYAGGGTKEILDVLNLSTGHKRLVESHASDSGEHFGGWVLNARGVVVYILSYGGVGSHVVENTASGDTRLASGAADEYTSLGISSEGDVAYWLDNGHYSGAAI